MIDREVVLFCRAAVKFRARTPSPVPAYTANMRLPAALFAAAVLTASAAHAQRLPAGVSPDHYDLAFVVDLTHERFDGVETIRVNVAAPTNRIVLNAVDIDFREVTIGSG